MLGGDEGSKVLKLLLLIRSAPSFGGSVRTTSISSTVLGGRSFAHSLYSLTTLPFENTNSASSFPTRTLQPPSPSEQPPNSRTTSAWVECRGTIPLHSLANTSDANTIVMKSHKRITDSCLMLLKVLYRLVTRALRNITLKGLSRTGMSSKFRQAKNWTNQ